MFLWEGQIPLMPFLPKYCQRYCQLSFVNNLKRLHWFCLTSLSDWSRKLAPFFKQIRCKTNTNHDIVIRVFPRFGNIFLYCRWVLLCSRGCFAFFKRMIWVLWFWFKPKSTLRGLSSREHGLKLATRGLSLERKQSLRGWWSAGHRSKYLGLRELLKTILKKNDHPKRFLSILRIDVDS